jgi:hypothetical protein
LAAAGSGRAASVCGAGISVEETGGADFFPGLQEKQISGRGRAEDEQDREGGDENSARSPGLRAALLSFWRFALVPGGFQAGLLLFLIAGQEGLGIDAHGLGVGLDDAPDEELLGHFLPAVLLEGDEVAEPDFRPVGDVLEGERMLLPLCPQFLSQGGHVLRF